MSPRTLLWPVLVLAVGGGIAWYAKSREPAGPGGGGEAPAPAAPPVEERPEPVRTRTRSVVETVPAEATATAPPVVLQSTVRAPVMEIAKAGDSVRAGDLLVRLNPASWKEALREAEEAGDGTRVAEAKEQLAGMEIRAPVDGIVFSVHASLGDFPPTYKGAPRPMVVLFDWKGLRLRGTAPASLAPFVRRGGPVLLSVGDRPPFPGGVTEAGEPGEDGTFPLEAAPLGPPPAAPEPGTEAAILVETGTREVLVVPSGAVTTSGPVSTVRVVPVEGEPVERRVTVVHRFPDGMVQVTGVDRHESVMVPRAGH